MGPSITDWLCLVNLPTYLFPLCVNETSLVVKATTHPALNNYGTDNNLLKIPVIPNACRAKGGNWFKFKPMVSKFSIHMLFLIFTRFYAPVVTGLHKVYISIGLIMHPSL